MAASSMGKFEQALVWYGVAAALLAAQGSLTDLCRVEVSRGLLHYRLGHLDRAQAAFQRAIPAGWALSASQRQRAWVALASGYVYLANGDHTAAQTLFEQSQAYAQSGIDEVIEELIAAGLAALSEKK